jgi:hypothetical protein
MFMFASPRSIALSVPMIFRAVVHSCPGPPARWIRLRRSQTQTMSFER